ncbi:MAG: 3'-5' exonuclease, partial [Blautia marasmi]
LYQRLRREYGEENAELFAPKKLNYKVKKQGPVTPAQKRHLQELVKYHRIELSVDVESLTKNEASRLIDTILGSYGKIMR